MDFQNFLPENMILIKWHLTIILLCGENLFNGVQILYALKKHPLAAHSISLIPGHRDSKILLYSLSWKLLLLRQHAKKQKEKELNKKIEEERKCGFLRSKSDLSPPHHPTIAGSTDKKKREILKHPISSIHPRTLGNPKISSYLQFRPSSALATPPHRYQFLHLW